jgi:hypothetical protein
MKLKFTIALLLFANMLNAQCVDKAYIDRRIKEMFPEANVDSVMVYFINGKYITSYDTLELTNNINNFSKDEITHLYYSKVKACGYQPGHGTIYISTGEFGRSFREKLIKRLKEKQKKKTTSTKKARS